MRIWAGSATVILMQGRARKKRIAANAYVVTAILIAMLVLSSSLLLHLYGTQGVYWDFITHYLYSKALINSYLYKSMLNGTLSLAIQYENHFYLEPFRAPLMSVLMAPFDLAFGQNAIPYYLVFEIIMLLSSAIYLARSMHVSPLMVAPLLILPYSIIYLTVLNGAEMLSLILVVFAIALAVKGKWQAGIFIALAALSKYSSMVFVLPILLMPKGTRWNTLAAGFFTTMPWLIANAIIFGNPLYSYISAIQQVFVAPPPSSIHVLAALQISISTVFYDLAPFAVLAVLLAAIAYIKVRKLPRMISDRYKITLAFFGVAMLAWFAFAAHASMNTLPRWGYVIYAGAAPLLSLLIYDSVKAISRAYKNEAVKRAAIYFTYSVVLLLFFSITLTAYAQMGSHPFGSFMGSKSQALLNAVQQIHALGMGNCSFVSNAWPYLQFYGIAAHNPYYYNSTMYRYPIVVFDSFISSGNEVAEYNITKAYNYTGFQIYIPANSTC